MLNHRSHAATATDLRLGIGILFFLRIDQTLACVRSVLPSGLPIYILNNGSSEASRLRLGEAFRHESQVRLIDSDQNLGVAAGRNRLLAESREDWLLMVDNDIVITTPEWPDVFRRARARNPEAEVLVPRLFDVQNGRFDPVRSVELRGTRLGYRRLTGGTPNRFPGGCAIVSRRLFDRLGPYDEHMFVGYEDAEIAVRAIRSGSPIAARLVPEMACAHDHQPPRTAEDRLAALERYSTAHIEASFAWLARKHGLADDPRCADWSKGQLRRMLQLDGSFRYEVAERVRSWFRTDITEA